MKYRQIVITDSKQFPIELYMNFRKRQKYTEGAAIELMKELQHWNTRTEPKEQDVYPENQSDIIKEKNEAIAVLGVKLKNALEEVEEANRRLQYYKENN